MDFKSAFLNEYLGNEIYVEQPDAKQHEDKVLKLTVGWNRLKGVGTTKLIIISLSKFVKSLCEPTLYVTTNTNILIFPLYVYNLIFIGNN